MIGLLSRVSPGPSLRCLGQGARETRRPTRSAAKGRTAGEDPKARQIWSARNGAEGPRGNLSGRGVGPARRGFTAFRRHAGMVPRAGHGCHGRPKRPSSGMLSADRGQASSGGRRPPAPSPFSAFGAGSWRRHRVHTRLRTGGLTCPRGWQGMPESRAAGRPLDRSAHADRPIRPVRRGSSRAQRKSAQGPTREPAVAASGVSDALPRAGKGGCERPSPPAPSPVSFVFLAPRDRSRRPRRRKAARFTRDRRAASSPRGRDHFYLEVTAPVIQCGYASEAAALRPIRTVKLPKPFPVSSLSFFEKRNNGYSAETNNSNRRKYNICLVRLLTKMSLMNSST
jgi:hypothetical protein